MRILIALIYRNKGSIKCKYSRAAVLLGDITDTVAQLHSHCSTTALPLQHDCTPTAARLHSHCSTTALPLQHGCTPTVARLHSHCSTTALPLQHDCTPTAARLHSNCSTAALPLQNDFTVWDLELIPPKVKNICICIAISYLCASFNFDRQVFMQLVCRRALISWQPLEQPIVSTSSYLLHIQPVFISAIYWLFWMRGLRHNGDLSYILFLS